MACVDAARWSGQQADEVALLHVTDAGAVDAAQGAFSALLGRGGAGRPSELEAMAEAAATRGAGSRGCARLARPAQQLRQSVVGKPEREVVAAAQDAALLVLGRQGAEAGPRSLGKAARFVVDHAACPVLLVWPGPALSTHCHPPPHDPRRTTAAATRRRAGRPEPGPGPWAGPASRVRGWSRPATGSAVRRPYDPAPSPGSRWPSRRGCRLPR